METGSGNDFRFWMSPIYLIHLCLSVWGKLPAGSSSTLPHLAETLSPLRSPSRSVFNDYRCGLLRCTGKAAGPVPGGCKFENRSMTHLWRLRHAHGQDRPGGPDRPAWRDGLGESGRRQRQHVCVCRVAVTSGS